ncbi:hypothetical protein L2D08_07170 [Domibacillus sp. PGB-M46]|uniref:hypothetical protein n=1 Tax=Domibacillus sp. PGB-M46 TaxID=2910255 RepID=UPI001F56AA22|nr:hypothetical protein [Domibacillus sp. PGB-M46]MCI2254141.1 hypothetical protein [Domibacillus sp. PGB-M46]
MYTRMVGALMELIIKDLLINFLFVLIPVFFMQMLYLVSCLYRFKKVKASWFVVFPVMSFVLCMLFPFSFGDGFNFDLRRVPFLLGILYGEPGFAAWLLPVFL